MAIVAVIFEFRISERNIQVTEGQEMQRKVEFKVTSGETRVKELYSLVHSRTDRSVRAVSRRVGKEQGKSP